MLDKLRVDRSIANHELGALLLRNLLVPVVHGDLRRSRSGDPLLASRGEFSTSEEPMEDIAVKLAGLVAELIDEEADNTG